MTHCTSGGGGLRGFLLLSAEKRGLSSHEEGRGGLVVVPTRYCLRHAAAATAAVNTVAAATANTPAAHPQHLTSVPAFPRELPNGNLEVGVHIADVTHFVKPSTPIDREASSRATTTYLVDRRIDMLPKPLTEDICSLRWVCF
jgi:hypothetical protein